MEKRHTVDDPRERRRHDRSSSLVGGGATLSGPIGQDPDWPAHPWVGLVARYGRPSGAEPVSRPTRVIVIWWPTAAGPQPVLFVVRDRRH